MNYATCISTKSLTFSITLLHSHSFSPPPIGFVGILFPINSDPAYSIARMWLAMGFVIGFIAANFGDLAPRLYLLLAVVMVTVILYLVVEITVYLQSSKQPSHPGEDEIKLAAMDNSTVSTPEPSNDDK